MVESIGPYRVVERLGVGGMGEVYKAYDDRLDRWVAIKRIRPDKENAEDNRERFQREARATAKLNHSSIVHVYDIFLDGDSECIVMEYVEGRTLDTMILEGPLDSNLAARLGYEISSGLAEAHAKGIIHRDLKVENIIITPTGHAKILDFGLAKPIISNELDTSLTGKGQLVGTSRAMSPEYVSGEEIDHRSDLFSFGVLLYEAATGHSPFKAHNTLATLKQVMLHVQTPAYQVNTEVTEEFSGLIDRLLEKDPSDRPQSADEVALEFESILGGLSSESIPRPKIGGSSTFRRSSSAFSATATAVENISQHPWAKRLALFLAIAIAAIVWVVFRSPQPEEPIAVVNTVEVKERILVGAFENRTAETELTDAAYYAFRTGLEQANNLQILSNAQIRDALKRMELSPDTAITVEVGTELCRREGIKAMVYASILRIGEVYQVTGTVIDPRTGGSTFTENAEANNKNEIISALSQISKEIRVNLGESVEHIAEEAPLQKVTTSNFEALQAYSLAIEELSQDNSDSAIELLESALGIDPDFSMAHAKLATVYIDSKKDYLQAIKHIDLALAGSEGLTSVEKFYLKGWSARLRGTAADVIQVWTLMSQLYPERQDAHYNKGMALLLYRYAMSEAADELYLALDNATEEEHFQIAYPLLFLEISLDRLEAAETSLKRLPASFQPGGRAQLLLAKGQDNEARQLIEELAKLKNPVAVNDLQVLRLQLRILQGELRQAFETTQKTFDPTLSNNVLERMTIASLADLLYDDPRDIIRQAATIDQTAFEKLMISGQPVDTAPVPALSMIGKIASRNQLTEESQAIHAIVSMLAKDKKIPVWDAHIQMLEGEILLAQGDEEQALRKLQDSQENAEFIQNRESMGEIYRRTSDFSAAIDEYQWIVQHRGRAMMECQRGCSSVNLRDWVLAYYHLGLAFEAIGNEEQAKAHYERFLRQWSAVEDIDVVVDARQRLQQLN